MFFLKIQEICALRRPPSGRAMDAAGRCGLPTAHTRMPPAKLRLRAARKGDVSAIRGIRGGGLRSLL
jgi:hypothetical protein